MVTQEQGFTVLPGINVYDAIVVSQLIEKLLRNGLVTGKELGHVASLRNKFHALVKQAVSVDIDNPPAETKPALLTPKEKTDE